MGLQLVHCHEERHQLWEKWQKEWLENLYSIQWVLSWEHFMKCLSWEHFVKCCQTVKNIFNIKGYDLICWVIWLGAQFSMTYFVFFLSNWSKIKIYYVSICQHFLFIFFAGPNLSCLSIARFATNGLPTSWITLEPTKCDLRIAKRSLNQFVVTIIVE